ncbi:MAG TPA: molybdopterin-dependent oxidoreductase [Methylomirabilota bacterium]|nr:molybdopterin-dependent oxidoreductase [Methylomirabilota bacterium]
MAPTPSAPVPSRGAAAVAGIVAGGVALAATELLAGILPGAPSVVLEIGAFLISLQPPGAKQLVVDLFGTADKLVLNIVIVLGALVLAAVLGILARYHRSWTTAGFTGIAVLGLLASLRDPLVDGLLALIAAVVGVAVAYNVIGWLLRLATPSGDEAEMPDWGRRRFIGTSVGVAALAVAGGGVGRILLNSRADAAPTPGSIPPAVDPVPPLAAGTKLDVDGITPIVVSNRDFYRIDTQLLTPRIDASTWTLSVDGMVDHPFSLNYAELLAMEMHEEYVTIACVSNEVGGDLVGNALWKGVRLRELLDRAGVQSGASQIVGHSFDGWTAGFPTAWLDDPAREALVAVAMNGDPLPAEHGFPARLIVPGLYGYVSATKWLTSIGLTTLEAFNGYWVPLGWAKEAPILTQSRIDVPKRGDSVNAGTVAVAGVAWAPDRGIAAVEVQVDDGPWVRAELSAQISDATWVQWLYRWPATAGTHLLSVRATDGTGEVQTTDVTRPAPDGARGHHTISVQVNG